MAVDAEALTSAGHAFSSHIQSELNRSAVCHNTLMVDGRDHQLKSRKLELLEFVDGSDVKMATIADLQGLVYPGVIMMRTVVLAKDSLLDVFRVSSDTEHTYDYLFHTYSDNGAFALETSDGEWRSVDLGKEAPWKWLRDAKVARHWLIGVFLQFNRASTCGLQWWALRKRRSYCVHFLATISFLHLPHR